MAQPLAFDLARVHDIIKGDLPPTMQRCMFSVATRLFQAGFSQEDIEIVMRHYLPRHGTIRSVHAYYPPKGSNLATILALAKGGEKRSRDVTPQTHLVNPLFHGLGKKLSMEGKK